MTEPVSSAARLLPDVIPGLDLAVGLHRVADSPSLYISILRMFVDGHRDDAAAVRLCIAGSDWAGAVRRAHTVKGLAGTIGALELQDRARELEARLKDPEAPTGIDTTIDAFAAELAAIVAAIDAALPEPARESAAPPASSVDRQRLASACRELRDLLRTDDLRARDCLRQHQDLLRGAYGEQAGAIETAVDQFDFAAADTALTAACDAHGIALPS